jgi:hypothetical protein
MSESIKNILIRNFKICYHAQKVTRAEHIIQDMHQRMDEIYLIYSDFFKVSVIEAKDELVIEAEKLIKKELEENGKN